MSKKRKNIKYIVPGSVLTRVENPELVTVMNFNDTGDYFEIDGPAAVVWLQLAKGRSVTEITKNISKKYSASSEVASKNIDKLISKLLKHHLLMST